jgi:trk system potassium uptake protein TrkH
MQLYKAEVPSPVVDKLKPRVSETAKVLWKVYLLFTLLETALLMAGGMTPFDAVCHAFCTMPTGGFSTKNMSIAAFDSAYVETVIIIFMLIAGINFSLHYRMLKGNPGAFPKDPELRTFLALFGAFTVVITFDLYTALYPTVGAAFRSAAFQVSSILTTTGFVSADYDVWPVLSRQILLACMFLGGMAGSTGGGIKTLRILLLVKQAYLEIFRIIHPHAVNKLKLAGRTVPEDVVSSIWGFFIIYIGLFIIASLLMSVLGMDMASSFAAVAASIGNIGPGLGQVGPAQNYLGIPLAGKWILVFCMLLGRLEIYTVIVLLTPEFWRK